MHNKAEDHILSVSQVTASIRDLLESHYRFLHVCGEISNLKTPFSGHSYFTLKDADAQLRVVLFKQQKRFVAKALADGQQVVVFGRISVYEPRGEYQLIADSVEAYGIGNLLREFELLKKRLGDRGFFAPERKKPLPPYPKKIAIITSPTGAAIQDFLKVVATRAYPLQITILPVKVQGQEAAGEICAAIARAQKLPDTEVVVLCRGGGSIEDLWAFNEEIVAAAIFHSAIPVVTGIGHETDSTIADFCADCRCPTPTAAAERLVPDGIALHRHLVGLRQGLQRHLGHTLERLAHRLRLQHHRLAAVAQLCSRLEVRLRLGEERLRQAVQEGMENRERRLHRTEGELRLRFSVENLELRGRHVTLLRERLDHHIESVIVRGEARLAEQAAMLQGLSPLATLARGYAVVRKPLPGRKRWAVVTSTEEVVVNEQVEVVLKDGQLACRVLDKIAAMPTSEVGPRAEIRPEAHRSDT